MKGFGPERAAKQNCIALSGLSFPCSLTQGFGRFAASPWALLPRAFGAGIGLSLTRMPGECGTIYSGLLAKGVWEGLETRPHMNSDLSWVNRFLFGVNLEN
jgi:hypothetical protein